MKEGLEKIISSRSRTFLAFCFSFIFGVGSFSFSEENSLAFYLYLSVFVIAFFLIIFWQNIHRRFILFCCLFFILGGLRFLWSMPNHSSQNINYYNGENREIVGWVSEEPTVQINKVKYILDVISGHIKGKILVVLPLNPQYEYGDELNLQCSLDAPRDAPDSSFVYSKYLARYNIYSICTNPKIKFVNKNTQGNWLIKNLLHWKTSITQQAENLWPEPEAGLMSGILYGARSSLPADLTQNFTRVGISHIIAISGYNITIIAVVLMNLLIFVGFYRQQSFWIVLVTIFLFVIFSGFSASAVRAGIMGTLVLVAGQLGRLSRIGNVLVLTVALMLLINPFVLIWDVGFQLSFLSTLGLVYLSPILENYFATGRLQKIPRFILDILLPTLSAIAATLPFILFQFGRLSVVAPLVNMLVLWIIPWLMLGGFLALLLSFIFYPLGQVIAWVALLGLKYVIIITNWFGSKNWSAVDISLPWWGMVGMYLLLFLVIRKKYEAKNKNNAVGQRL